MSAADVSARAASPPAPASPEGLVSLDLVLTAGCNLACGYCFQNAKTARRMEWEAVRAAVDLLLFSRREEVSLHFFGGEPLLEFPLVRRAVEYVREAAPGRNVRFAMVTNGTLVTPEIAAFLAEHRVRTRLSFDGVPAAQDLRGRGTFERLDRLLDFLRANHIRYFRRDLEVSVTLVASAIRFLADSVDYFLDKGLTHFSISPRYTHEPDWRRERIDELDRAFARIFRACLRHYRDTGDVPLELFRRHRGESVHAPAGRSMCGVGRGETLTVDVDGQVYGCTTFAESFQSFPSPFLRSRLDTMKMGDLRAPEFRDRLAAFPSAARDARLFDAKEEKHSSYARCGECRHRRECSVCPTSIGHIPGNDDPHRVPDFLCAYYLVSLGYREKFPKQEPDPISLLTSRARIPRLVADTRARRRHSRSTATRERR